MRLRAVALAPAAILLLASCGGSDDGTEVVESAGPTSTTGAERSSGLNARGAVEIALGETATVSQSGAIVLEVSDTALTTEGCPINTTDPDQITKKAFQATVAIGDATATQWLWQSDFYYVDNAGKIAKNLDTSDATPCSTRGSNAFIDLPANSSADGTVTLDVPNDARVIGYHTTQSGDDVRIEWVLPEVAAAPESEIVEEVPVSTSPAVTTARTTDAPAPAQAPVGSPPVGYTGAPIGDPQPLVGKVIDYCMDSSMYQTGTTMFTDGTTGWTQECAAG
ncbi:MULTISPECIES: acyltransferase [Rhodococcus]|uniref:acyltransferase n=1 Tax=Rhodococcus TaxID=1827 RepID=UPI00143E65A2|nr:MULTISPECIES: acyltransferase [Rhodococcus]QIX48960.1 acyltransferase [Rhodococcus sp. DMU1]QRI75989.1 acyltransferase [Rhodococcus aetherivorans]QSE59400.1 acyltransferase [Rhodococcus sp. PSBB066]QSE69275.1 acyltransferase [Rhodococcus sp. PSBB049]